MGEEWMIAMAVRFIKEGLPLMLPPLWNGLRTALVRTLPNHGDQTNLHAIVDSHTEQLARLHTDVQTQTALQMQLHEKIRLLTWGTLVSAGMAFVAIIIVIIMAVIK